MAVKKKKLAKSKQSADEGKKAKRKPKPAGDSEQLAVKQLTLQNINSRSIQNKIEQLENILLDYKPYVVTITETWLSSEISSHEIVPPKYSVIKKDRPTRAEE